MYLDSFCIIINMMSALLDTRGSSDYCSTKRVLQGNLSYYKMHPLHSFAQMVHIRLLQPLQAQHLLSNKKRLSKRMKILFLQLQWCLHNAQLNLERTSCWSIFNPANNRFAIVFPKPSNSTYPTKHATHQDSD